MYVILFAIIGGMRGWAKEMLVTFSVILALTFTTLLANYVPFIRDVLQKDSKPLYFWLRTIILILLVFFGYQTPNIPRFAAKMTREKLQDIILGVVIGALNGYLIAGTIWFYMADAGYPFPGHHQRSHRRHCQGGRCHAPLHAAQTSGHPRHLLRRGDLLLSLCLWCSSKL